MRHLHAVKPPHGRHMCVRGALLSLRRRRELSLVFAVAVDLPRPAEAQLPAVTWTRPPVPTELISVLIYTLAQFSRNRSGALEQSLLRKCPQLAAGGTPLSRTRPGGQRRPAASAVSICMCSHGVGTWRSWGWRPQGLSSRCSGQMGQRQGLRLLGA